MPHLFERVIVRRILQRMEADGELDAKQRAAVRKVLGRPRMMGALHYRLDELMHQELKPDQITKLTGQQAQAGAFQQLLEWLWEHREEILAFVKQIVALFSR